MLLFGHLGITAGVVRAGDFLASLAQPGDGHQSASSLKAGAAASKRHPRYWLSRAKGRLGTIDYRLVLLGSLLPDLIDKPAWLAVTALTGEASLSGRDCAHTLLFNLVLLFGGLFLIRYKKSWLLTLWLASFWHLVFDRIWESPVVLFWPLLGPLPKEKVAGWWSDIIEALFSSPETYIPEIIGLVIISLFAYRLILKKSVLGFLKNGTID